ncbi:myb-related transcription factor, partner of profilin-like [Saccostrea echinata]|uniref:myb-related transcription factor, partner of profilin-like n=1 Tax=Saccostrea echinata TaxID=191078 RepID=UPI002A805C62|nr:myb-related transcription factor, partner of profilin-like [Saccostrea echinata]
MKSAPIFSVELLFIENFWFDKKTPSRISRKRSPNFSQIEMEILLDEVEKNRAILFSKFSKVFTNSSKKRAWEAICEKINKANNIDHCRTVVEVKKWSSYMSEMKKKAAQNRRETGKTGGGPPPQGLNPTQEKIVGIIGCTPISGIEGGIDTCEVTGKKTVQ